MHCEFKEEAFKKLEMLRLPDWNELPEYGLEALVSTIDDEKELLAAVRRDGMRYAKLMTEATNGGSSTRTISPTSARRSHLSARIRNLSSPSGFARLSSPTSYKAL